MAVRVAVPFGGEGSGVAELSTGPTILTIVTGAPGTKECFYCVNHDKSSELSGIATGQNPANERPNVC